MEYTDGDFSNQAINRHAYWYNVHLDTRFKPQRDDAIDAVSHYEDCKRKPTIAMLARKNKETNNYPDFKLRNKYIIEKFPEVKTAKDSFNSTYNKLYPKTKNARKYLIDKEFVILDYVKPRVKTFGKMMFKLLGI